MNVISFGARQRYPIEGRGQLAHRFDPLELEGVPQQAANFMVYAKALGGYDLPHILISPEPDPDPVQEDSVQVQMSIWSQVVESGLHEKVEIR